MCHDSLQPDNSSRQLEIRCYGYFLLLLHINSFCQIYLRGGKWRLDLSLKGFRVSLFFSMTAKIMGLMLISIIFTFFYVLLTFLLRPFLFVVLGEIELLAMTSNGRNLTAAKIMDFGLLSVISNLFLYVTSRFPALLRA